MSIMKKGIRAEMPDGSVWIVPVSVIAYYRAGFYSSKFDDDLETSLHEDTLPLFERYPEEIMEWVKGETNWSDVEGEAICVEEPKRKPEGYQDGWLSGEHTLEEMPAARKEEGQNPARELLEEIAESESRGAWWLTCAWCAPQGAEKHDHDCIVPRARRLLEEDGHE